MADALVSRKRHASSSVSSTVGDVSTECPICLEQMTEPKILSCGHNFCYNCVESKIAQSVQTPSGQQYKRYICPLCKQGTALKGGQQLATNYALKELMDKAKKMRHDEHAKDKLIQQLTGGNSAMECDMCQEKTPSSKAYACMRNECLVHYEWEEAGRSRSNTALLAKKFCANCVCLHHHQHEIIGVEKMATIREISAAVDIMKAAKQTMSDYFLDEPKTAKMKFCGHLLVPIMNDLMKLIDDSLSSIRAPQTPLRKTDLLSKRASVKTAWADAMNFLDSTKWIKGMQGAVRACYSKALEEFKAERDGAQQE